MHYHQIILHEIYGKPKVIFNTRQPGSPETDTRIFSSPKHLSECTLPGVKVLKTKALRHYLSLTRRYRTGKYKNEEVFL